jgi:Bacterial Ig-like domain (group 2)/SdrD B-like domain
VRNVVLLLHFTALASFCSVQPNGLAIYGNAGIGDAIIHLSGAETASTTSYVKGFYFFNGLKPGKYLVTPTLSGYTFNPPSQSVTLTNASVGSVSFTMKAVNRKETGLTESPLNSTLKASGATEQLQVEATYSDGNSRNVTANATYASNNTSVAKVSQSGVVTAFSNGNATIVASYGGLASSVSVTVNIPVATYGISGNAGIGGATIMLSGASTADTTASATGTYSFSGVKPGNYVITPSLTGYTFTPASQAKTITDANTTGVNFTATAVSHVVDLGWSPGSILDPAPGQVVVGYNVYRSSVSGGPYTKLNSSPVAGLTYADTAVSAGQTWYYVCSTVDNLGDVSAQSKQAAATVP